GRRMDEPGKVITRAWRPADARCGGIGAGSRVAGSPSRHPARRFVSPLLTALLIPPALLFPPVAEHPRNGPLGGSKTHGWPLADDALIRQVKEANDIVHVVGSYVDLRPAGPTFKGLCPFHDDHRPSFDVDPRRQRYKCWSCNKYGDVISFVQEHERITFPEALELLARRAGIPLENQGASPQAQGRALMLEAIRWAAELFQRCLLDDDLGEQARHYLGERRLLGETVRRFGLGYAPLAGDWLVRRARAEGVELGRLEEVGLIARRTEGNGYYDRFRDRVMFPIRDAL